MPAGFWWGVLAPFVAVSAVGAVYVAGLIIHALWLRWVPIHWQIAGLTCRARPAREVFRHTIINVGGAHASTLRRLVRVGPWGVYVIRYRPGPINPQEDR